jgi:hypothetical protein
VKGDNEEAGEGARIQLTGQDGQQEELQADAYGEFYFNGATPGKGQVEVQLDGYATEKRDIDVSMDVTALGDIVLRKK